MSVLPKDITYIRTIIANVVLVGEPGTPDWVLVDAGVATFADNISKIALERFGTEQPLSRRWPSPDMASPCMETSWNEGSRH
jgi:hypothetical protein